MPSGFMLTLSERISFFSGSSKYIKKRSGGLKMNVCSIENLFIVEFIVTKKNSHHSYNINIISVLSEMETPKATLF